MSWRFRKTPGSPALVRKCARIAIVAVENAPTSSFFSALPSVHGGFAIAAYAESALAIKLGYTLERLSGPIDFSFRDAWRDVNRRMRTAGVQGELLIGNGRRESAFFGGTARFLDEMRKWEVKMRDWLEGGRQGPPPRQPNQLIRLLEFEAAGVPVVEFPPSAGVNNRFAGLTLIRPVVISTILLREAERSGALRIEWGPE